MTQPSGFSVSQATAFGVQGKSLSSFMSEYIAQRFRLYLNGDKAFLWTPEDCYCVMRAFSARWLVFSHWSSRRSRRTDPYYVVIVRHPKYFAHAGSNKHINSTSLILGNTMPCAIKSPVYDGALTFIVSFASLMQLNNRSCFDRF